MITIYVACGSLLIACHALGLGLITLLDSLWREIEIGACAWWEDSR